MTAFFSFFFFERVAGTARTGTDVFYTSAVNTPEGREALATASEKDELGRSVATGRVSGMHTIVLTTFQLDDYKEFLERMLPAMDTFQVIHVSDE